MPGSAGTNAAASGSAGAAWAASTGAFAGATCATGACGGATGLVSSMCTRGIASTGRGAGGAGGGGGATSTTGASSSASSGSASPSPSSAACGRIVFTRRGGGSAGAAGFGGSGFLAVAAGFFVFDGGASTKMSPVGTAMPRWRARRSTKDRATTSSIELEAVFTSMPWSRLSSATTSWLVVPSSSATL